MLQTEVATKKNTNTRAGIYNSYSLAMDKLLIVCLLGICFFSTVYGVKPNFQFVEEWNLWKGQHEKSYASQLEELERHLVWLSNKKYIEQHNANSHVFGFTLAMNHFGDLVSIVVPAS